MANTSLVVDIKGDSRQFRNEMQSVRGTISSAFDGLGKIGLAGMGLSAISSGLRGIVSAGAGVVGLAADAETTATSFGVLLGSAEQARDMMVDLRKFTSTTPFQELEVNDAAKKLLAFGSNSNKVTDELRQLGDIASGVGIPIGDLAEIYGKARTSGRLFAEDINQLTGRGIPIIKQLAEQFGVAF